MGDSGQQPQNGKAGDGFRRLLIGIAWGLVILLFLAALVATWFLGLGPVIVLGWIVVVLGSALILFVAYDVRKTFLGAGTLLFAVILFGASFFHEEGWSVDASQLQVWGIGAVAFAVWVIAWDTLKHRIYPFVTNAAGVLAFSGCLIYGLLVVAYGNSVVANPKGLLSIAVIGGLYGLTKKPWKNLVSVAALFAAAMLLLNIIKEWPPA